MFINVYKKEVLQRKKNNEKVINNFRNNKESLTLYT
jgi:hypothetical protein